MERWRLSRLPEAERAEGQSGLPEAVHGVEGIYLELKFETGKEDLGMVKAAFWATNVSLVQHLPLPFRLQPQSTCPPWEATERVK